MENLAKEQPSCPIFVKAKEATHRYNQGNHTILEVDLRNPYMDIAWPRS